MKREYYYSVFGYRKHVLGHVAKFRQEYVMSKHEETSKDCFLFKGCMHLYVFTCRCFLLAF